MLAALPGAVPKAPYDDALAAGKVIVVEEHWAPLVPHVPEWLSPLTAVVPGQVAALRLALLRQLDIDRPTGLAKVTLTR